MTLLINETARSLPSGDTLTHSTSCPLLMALSSSALSCAGAPSASTRFHFHTLMNLSALAVTKPEPSGRASMLHTCMPRPAVTGRSLEM